MHLGKPFVDPEINGIEFTRGLALGVPDGEFMFVQVINQTNSQYLMDNGVTRRIFGAGLLDGDVPYAGSDGLHADDSPGMRLSPAFSDHAATNADYFSDFSMFLMWKSDRTQSTYVPLRVLPWQVGAGAQVTGGVWVETFHSFSAGQSADTIDYPEWHGKAPENLSQVDGD
jgi:hypothetical protein